MLEAYQYVAEYVADRIRIESEAHYIQHPLIDDSCDGRGHYFTEVGHINNGGEDGLLADQTFLEPVDI
jgi:hypothetical protein